MGFRGRRCSQLHVTDNDNCAVAFYPSLLSISFIVETAVTVNCLCLIDHHVLCGGLTTRILNIGTGRRQVFNFRSQPLYPGNELLYPVNQKLGVFRNLYGHFGEKENFFPFPTDDPPFLDCPANRLVNLCLRTEVTRKYQLI